jgi:hypothetical protein
MSVIGVYINIKPKFLVTILKTGYRTIMLRDYCSKIRNINNNHLFS